MFQASEKIFFVRLACLHRLQAVTIKDERKRQNKTMFLKKNEKIFLFRIKARAHVLTYTLKSSNIKMSRRGQGKTAYNKKKKKRGKHNEKHNQHFQSTDGKL